jgi:Xaa-Pro aminopeptidase
VEPGIYIPPQSPCDPKWWGIGCRIEDDILITEKAPENLSAGVPRTPEAIEALIREASFLESWLRAAE